MGKTVNVGIIGFGIVGSGTFKVLTKNRDEIKKKLDADLVVKKIADLDTESDRGISFDKSILTKDAQQILEDPEIDIVVETIGGTNPAKKFILQALENGKHVVTANKKLLAEEGQEIFKKAEEKNRLLLFEAAVGGAIPIIRTAKTSLVSEHIKEVRGILNGTSNYILSKLSEGELSFEQALKLAQEKGFAEADPSFDINGTDAAHKIALLSRLIFGVDFDFKDIFIEGIEDLQAEDFLLAKKLGFEIKLLAISRMQKDKFFVCVHPTFLDVNSDLAQISGVKNAVTFFGDNFGELSFCGPGAGSLPTGTAILADVISAARHIALERGKCIPLMNFLPQHFKKVQPENILSRTGEYYIRFTFPDVAGVFAQVSKVLASKDISIASLIQTGDSQYGEIAKAAMILHDCSEKDLLDAKREIDKLPFMKEESFFMRIER